MKIKLSLLSLMLLAGTQLHGSAAPAPLTKKDIEAKIKKSNDNINMLQDFLKDFPDSSESLKAQIATEQQRLTQLKADLKTAK